MSYQSYLGDSYLEETQEFNAEKAKEQAKKERGNLNIVLMGATGVGKSSLVNAVFGDDVVKSGDGQPITQHLEKIQLPDAGITLWDTKGIEAKNYKATKEQLFSDLQRGFQEACDSKDINKMPHLAWLCIKESSRRFEDRELDLLNILESQKIPTIVVFTDTMKAGDGFYKDACTALNNKYGFFLKNRFVRVNSVEREIDEDYVQPKKGLEALLEITEQCLGDVNTFCKEAFLKAQKIDIKKRKQAMIDSSKKAVHMAAAAAATAGASPIPGSDAPIIAAVQSKMIHSINGHFEVHMSTSTATSAIMSILGVTAVASVGKTIVSTALKFIPGTGSVIGGAISASTAAVLTEAIGFAYIAVMEKYFDDDLGAVQLPEHTDTIIETFKSFMQQKQ